MTTIIPMGPPGPSAYQLAVRLGFKGTLEDYIATAGGNIQLSKWRVGFAGQIIETATKVRYPRFVIERDGAQPIIVEPGDYGLTYFEVDKGGFGDAVFHCLDVTMVKPAQTAASPIKELHFSQALPESLTIVPLAIAYYDQVTYFAQATILNAVDVRSPELVFETGAPLRDDALGTIFGTPAAHYYPLGRVHDTGRFGALHAVSNAECSELAGYCKVVPPIAANAVGATVLNGSTGTITAPDFNGITAALLANDGRNVVLASDWNGHVSTSLNFRTARLGRNRFAGARVMVGPNGRPDYNDGESLQPTVTSEVRALGLTQGLKGGAGKQTAYNFDFAGQARKGDEVFVRFVIEVDADGAFGTQPCYIHAGPVDTVVATLAATVEQVLSDRARVYKLRFVNEWEQLLSIGVAVIAPSGASATITGLQIDWAHDATLGLAMTDYPDVALDRPVLTSADVAIPADLWLTAGRSVFFEGRGLYRDRRDDARVALDFFDNNLATPYAHPLLSAPEGSRFVIRLDTPGTFPSKITVTDPSGKKFIRDFSTKVAATASNKAVVILFIADSVVNRHIAQLVRDNLIARGMQVTLIGTVNQGTLDGSTVRGEAREGKEMGQYANIVPGLALVPLGQEAAYKNGDLGDQLNFNPLIDPRTGKPDINLYLQRMGFPKPTHIIQGLAGNDILHHDAATALANQRAALDLLLPAYRAVGADVKIGLLCHTWVFQPDTDVDNLAKWQGHHDSRKEHLKRVHAAVQSGDQNFFFLPSYVHQSMDNGFPIAVDSVDPDGMLVGSVSDLHYEVPNQYAEAEMNASWIAATA